MNTFVYYFFIFLLGAVVGRLGEKIAYPIIKKNLLKSGMLRGPYLPVYGFAALIITFILNTVDNLYLYLLLCIVSIAVLEYVASYLLECIFHKRWWDYSEYKFNLHGRITLVYSLVFGVYALIFYFAYPFISGILHALQSDVLTFVAGICVGVMAVDMVVSTIRLRKSLPQNRGGDFLK